VIIRNTNLDYQVLTIDNVLDPDRFSVTTIDTGSLSGNSGAYSLGFKYEHDAAGSSKTGGTLTAPTGDHADVQLIALRVRTGGRAGSTYDLTVPPNAVNGAGANTGLGDCFIPDFNVRSDRDNLSAVGATMIVNSVGSYSTFRFGNLGSGSLSVFIVTHF
jgi:hypothetical protein